MLCSLIPNPVPPALGPRARRCSVRGSREEPDSGAGLDSSQCPLPAELLFPARSVFPPEREGTPPHLPALPPRLVRSVPGAERGRAGRNPAGPVPGEGSRAGGAHSGCPSLRRAGDPRPRAALILDAHILLLHRNLRLGRYCFRGEYAGVTRKRGERCILHPTPLPPTHPATPTRGSGKWGKTKRVSRDAREGLSRSAGTEGVEGERVKKEAEGTRRPSREITELCRGERDTASKRKFP